MTQPKITLITPPDIFQNDQPGVMFVDINQTEQEQVTTWFSHSLKQCINLYFYQGEPNVPWLMHALSTVRAVYVNLDNWSTPTSYLCGYLLGKPHVYWSTTHGSIADVYQHINYNRVNTAVEFLERTLKSGPPEETQL